MDDNKIPVGYPGKGDVEELIDALFLRENMFFLGGMLGPSRGGSSVKVSTKRGGSHLFVSYSRGRVTHLLQNFLMWIFGMLLSIFRTD